MHRFAVRHCTDSPPDLAFLQSARSVPRNAGFGLGCTNKSGVSHLSALDYLVYSIGQVNIQYVPYIRSIFDQIFLS